MTAHSEHPIRNYRQLQVWKLAMDFVVDVYRISRGFPAEERFGLTAQVRRAAVSVAANIAEGHARHSRAEYRHFVSIARGSVAEVETELSVAARLGFASDSEVSGAHENARVIGSKLTKLWQSLG